MKFDWVVVEQLLAGKVKVRDVARDDLDEAIRQLDEQGLADTAIGTRLGMNAVTVRAALRRLQHRRDRAAAAR